MAAPVQDGASSSPNASTQDAAFQSAFFKAEKAALRLIARAEQNTNGLKLKLERRGHEPACASAVISRLVELKLVDDARYSRLWLESRLRLTRTPKRLLCALCAKGIPRDEALNALDEILDEDAEWALLIRYVKKHSRKKKGSEEASLKYLLKNEGFSRQAIMRYIKGESD